MKCPTCGQEIEFPSDILSIEQHGECFECVLWRERLSRIKEPNIAIIDGTFYTIDDENSKALFRGFGGNKFVINFKDGRQVVTTNLWCGGNIPEFWKPQFPDNADFDWQWRGDYLVPK